MSKETFNQLMGQFSAEAEAERIAEQRELERRKLLTKIANVFCWLLLAGVAVAGYCYREELGQMSEKFTGVKSTPAETVGAETPNKFKELLHATEKHAADVNSSGNLDARQAEVPGK